jgi:hypothetical protein
LWKDKEKGTLSTTPALGGGGGHAPVNWVQQKAVFSYYGFCRTQPFSQQQQQ